MPRLYNLSNSNEEIPSEAVYIGRPSKYGNPFKVGIHGGRTEVIAKHKEYFLNLPNLPEIIQELKGKDLVCFCHPKTCHGDIILQVCNDDHEQFVEY